MMRPRLYMSESSELLDFLGITDEHSWRQWMLRNHPDKGGDNDKFVKAKAAWERKQGSNSNSNSSSSTEQKQRVYTEMVDTLRNVLGLDKRRECYGMTDFGKHCANDVVPGTKLCSKHSAKCHYILTTEDRQCNKNRRPDDTFCELHSTKPRVYKPKPQIFTCAHTKPDGNGCKARTQGKYCFRHKGEHLD